MSTGRPVTGTAILNDNNTQYLYNPSSNYSDSSLRTKNKINLSNYSTLYATFTWVMQGDFISLLATYSASTSVTSVAHITAASAGTFNIDISDINEELYIVHCCGGDRGGRVSKIWLE